MLEEKSLYVKEEMSALDERFVNAVCLFCECSFVNTVCSLQTGVCFLLTFLTLPLSHPLDFHLRLWNEACLLSKTA